MNDFVAMTVERIKALRKGGGNPSVLLTEALAATDAIENHVGAGSSDADRQALTAAQRFTYNIAADCWPAWSAPVAPADPRNLAAALELAQRSLALVRKLQLGPVPEGTGVWLVGAFELALGKYDEAATTFVIARDLFAAGKAPGLVLLTEGYIAIARQPSDVDAVCTKILAGGFEDGPEWIEQLRAAASFARGG